MTSFLTSSSSEPLRSEMCRCRNWSRTGQDLIHQTYTLPDEAWQITTQKGGRWTEYEDENMLVNLEI